MSEDLAFVYAAWCALKASPEYHMLLTKAGITPQFRGIDIATLEDYGKQIHAFDETITVIDNPTSDILVQCRYPNHGDVYVPLSALIRLISKRVSEDMVRQIRMTGNVGLATKRGKPQATLEETE